MGQVNTEKTFDAEAIRDTSVHNGITIALHEYRLKTVIIENSLDQVVSIYCEGSTHADFSHNFMIGSAPFDIPATTDTYDTCDSYFPYMRMVAQCDTAPTTGSLTIHFVQYGGS